MDEFHQIDEDGGPYCPIPGVTWASISRQVNRSYRRLALKYGWTMTDQGRSAADARKDIPEEQPRQMGRRRDDRGDEKRIRVWKIIRASSPCNQYKLAGTDGVGLNGWRTRLLNAVKAGVVRFHAGPVPERDKWVWIGGNNEELERRARQV